MSGINRNMTDEELADFYDAYDFTEDMIEAEKNGDVIVSRPGENYFDAIARHEREKAQKAKPARTFTRSAQRRSVAAVAAM